MAGRSWLPRNEKLKGPPLAILLLVLLFPFALAYGEEVGRELHGEVTLMGKAVDNEDFKLKVGEYRLLESGSDPERGFSVHGRLNKNYLDATGMALNEKDQNYSSRLDVSRILSLSTTYDGFVHRLDHDPLNNLEFGPRGGFGSMDFTDANPGERNRTLRTEWENRVKVRLPFLRRVRFLSEYNESGERGHQQANTIGHCTSCHLDSSPLRIHQRSREWSLGPEADLGPLTLHYAFRRRTFDEVGKPLTADYPDIFPTVFRVRGPNPYASVPDTEKSVHQVGARLDLRQASFSATYADSDTENHHTDYRFGVAHLNLRGTLTPWRNLALTAQYRSVDRNSTVPGNIDRDIDAARVQVTYRIGRSTILTAGYENEEVERTNFPRDRPLSPGILSGAGTNAANFLRQDTHTRTDRHRIRLSLRPFRTLSARLGYRREHAARPFTRFGKQGGDIGAFAGVEKTPWPFPDLTRLPEDTDEVFAGFHWSIRPDVSLSADYRFRKEENDHVGREREAHSLTSVLWVAPIPRLHLTAAYTVGITDTHSDLQYGTSSFRVLGTGQVITPVIDRNVRYEDDVHHLSLGLELAVTPKFSLRSNLRLTNSKAAYDTEDLSPDIEGFSNLNIGQISASIGFSYLLSEAFAFYGGYSFDEYDDREFSLNRGKLHEMTFGFRSSF